MREQLNTSFEAGLRPVLPELIRPSELKHITPTKADLSLVKEIWTPDEILAQTEFEEPYRIDPIIFPSFKSLLNRRDYIRNLRLLPIKTDADQVTYHAQPHDSLKDLVSKYFGENDDLAMAPNKFPYFLPKDTYQYIVWIKDQSVQNEKVYEFVAKAKIALSVPNDEIILFERPKNTKSKLVKGTLPEFRHVHFWIRK